MTYHNAIKFLTNAPTNIAEPTAGNRMREFFRLLNNPQKELLYLRVTGTVGKTACATMTEAMLDSVACPVGLLTLTSAQPFRDCIQIHGKPIAWDDFAESVGTVYRLLKQNQKCSDPTPQAPTELTAHEILLCAAVLAFRKHGCRLCIIANEAIANDPSRILPVPLAAVICGNLPCDRPQELQAVCSYLTRGIQEIVCAPQNRESYRILSQICAKINCRLNIPAKPQVEVQSTSLRGSEFCYRQKPYQIRLCGQFQILNAALALETADMLTRHGFPLSERQLAEGLRRVRLSSQFECLSVAPTFIADRAHTAEAWEALGQTLSELQSHLGTRFSLCLPNDGSIWLGTSVLQAHRLTVAETVRYSPNPVENGSSDGLFFLSAKETADYMLRTADEPSVWLLVGAEAWLTPLRAELLKQLEKRNAGNIKQKQS